MDRFWSKADIKGPDDCWNWLSATNGHGYGRFRDTSGSMLGAHRVSYELTFGKIPDDMIVVHLCDNRLCVNPRHLMVATQQENLIDMTRKGRGKNQNTSKTHCPKGHEYNEDNTYLHNGRRACKLCKAETNRQLRAKRLSWLKEKYKKEETLGRTTGKESKEHQRHQTDV